MRRIASLVLAAGAACSSSPSKLDVVPSSVRFTKAGDAVILLTSMSDTHGNPVAPVPCSFFTGDPLIAEVRQDGTVTANGAGATEIRVRCDSLTAAVPVKVNLPAKILIEARCDVRCTRVMSEPLSLKLEGIGAGARLSARVLDEAGGLVPVEVEWEVADPDFRAGTRRIGADIGKDGELKATGAVGKYLVLASAGSVVARGNVEVTMPTIDVLKAQPFIWLKPGERATIEPKGFRRAIEGLKPISGARYTFTSNDPAVVTVDDDGRVTGVAVGATEVVVVAESGAFAQVRLSVSESDPTQKPMPSPRAIKGPARKVGKR